MVKKEGILFQIADQTRRDLERRKEAEPLEALKAKAAKARKAHDFFAPFRTAGMDIIAEVKLASPSEPQLARSAGPVETARAYLAAGATALSVLTEPHYFAGDPSFLRDIRAQFPEARLLMKDFIVDSYQLYEAKVWGADCVLLILSLLGRDKVRALYDEARALGLNVLVEVHDRDELNTAIILGVQAIGINNRNLKTMKVDTQTTLDLLGETPPGTVVISESGITSPEELKALRKAGCHGALVGTSLMRTGKPGEALARLLEGMRR